MPRARHPKKDVEEALRHAEEQGWRIEVGGSHAWGKMYCPYNDAAAAENFASRAFGVRRRIRETMRVS